MQLTCVLFCLENNSYLMFKDGLKFTKDYMEAMLFDDRVEAISFLSSSEKEITLLGTFNFTPREFFILKN